MKTFSPITPSKRQMVKPDSSQLIKGVRPLKKLTKRLKNWSGRNNQGRITVRHQGGGHRKIWRQVDFKQNRMNMPARVLSIEYDPNRSGFIALIAYKDGKKSYILAPQDLKVGDAIVTSEAAPLKPGNRMMLKNIPVGTFVHNVELQPGRGGQLARSAGNSVQIMACEGGQVHLLLPSSEIRMVSAKCLASIGALSNPEHNIRNVGKAGRSRWAGIRPRVRGTAMNPVDHPHGGGEGRAPIGLKHPKTPWGKPALGVKTRKRNKLSNKYIIRRRIKK
jgi:large subunit ribosomal protein L2